MTDERKSTGRKRRHYRLLFQLEESLEPVMFVLAFVWLFFFIEEFTGGLSPGQQKAVTVVWVMFILEFLLKLYLAPYRLRYIVQNWITAIALIIPAFRAFRLIRALRILRLARVTSTTRIVRALTSTKRAYTALRSAQGPAPEPAMNVAILSITSRDAGADSCQQFMQRVTGDVRAEIEGATGLRWTFDVVEPSTLEDGTPRRPADFLDEASQRMVEGPYDLVLVVTDVGLVSRKRQLVPGLVSPVARIAAISTRQLTAAKRGQSIYPLESDIVRCNAGALLLHLLGHIGGLKHRDHPAQGPMAPFTFRDSRRSLPRFDKHEREHLARAGARMPERELHGSNALAALIFHILMACRHPWDIVKSLIRNRAPLLPLSLPGLATAAVAPSFLLVFSAEIWDVGLGMTNTIVSAYAAISILGASFYLAWAQALFLPRKAKRVLTEHLAVANGVIFLSILFACVGLFVMVGALMLIIEMYIFPPDLVQTWPTLSQPDFTMSDTLRLAAFISTIGVTTGALAGGLESRTVIQHLALFEDEQ